MQKKEYMIDRILYYEIPTGFCSLDSLFSGVSEGIQKLGSLLSSPLTILDTDDALPFELVLGPAEQE